MDLTDPSDPTDLAAEAHSSRAQSACITRCPLSVVHYPLSITMLSWQEIRHDPLLLVACGFGSGILRPAPGTWGSLVGFLLFLPLATLPEWAYGAVVLGGAVLGVPLCTYAGKRLGMVDHPAIVWDEVVGVWLALACLPFELAPLVVGFVLFRVFDIIKPWPISWLERSVPGGLGVMLDDIAAGLVVLLIMQGLLWIG